MCRFSEANSLAFNDWKIPNTEYLFLQKTLWNDKYSQVSVLKSKFENERNWWKELEINDDFSR